MSQFEKGASFIRNGACFPTACIDHHGAASAGGTWEQRIQCFGATKEEAEAFRDQVLAALQDQEAITELAGGHWWGEHDSYPRCDWRDEVASGSTQRGYWDWVRAQLEEDE